MTAGSVGAPGPGRAPTLAGGALLPSLGWGSLAGVLYFLAFPGFDLAPLAVFALVPLLYAIDREVGLANTFPTARVRRRVLTLGVVFGTVTNIGGYYWLVDMLAKFSGFPLPICVLFALIVCAYQGGLLTLLVALAFRARTRGWSFMLVLPATFGASELVYPLLFPSYYGACFHDWPVALQIADLGGPIAVTAVACALNGALYEVARARVTKAPLPWRGALAVLGVVAASLGYGAYRIADVDARSAASPSIDVAIIQTSMGIYSKWDDPYEGHRRHIAQTRALEATGAPIDLVVWPESAYTFFVPEAETNLRDRVLGPVRSPLLFGGLARRHVDGKERHFNTAFITDERGELRGTYDKTFLLMFGEYLPFGETFPILYDWSPHSGRFTQGSHVRPLPFRDYRIATLVCYEDILPAFVRRFFDDASAEPHVFANLTNDSWFGDTSEPWQHLALAKFRSIEHHRWMIRSTNSGVSGLIDPAGRLVVRGGVETRETLLGRVHMMTGRTVYAVIGDVVGWLAVLGCVVMGWVGRR